MNGIPRGTLRLRIWCQRRKSSTCFLERVAAPPEQLRLEALPAQLVELVEMDLACALVAAKLTPERAEMVAAARHQGREPSPGLVLRLVELHRQIDITDLERPARIGAEDPDLAHPRQVATLAVRDVTEETLDPVEVGNSDSLKFRPDR
jgi:hypothetical protein